MIYVCNHCETEILELRTPGDEMNRNFLCPPCAKVVKEDLKKHQDALHDFLNSVETTY